MKKINRQIVITYLRQTLIAGFIFLSFPCLTKAQDADEYLLELGGSIGGSYYLGDANYSVPFKHTGINGGIMVRYLMNPHMAIKANLNAGKIAGDTRDFANQFPQKAETKFKRAIFDLGAQYEYNFLPYGNGNRYRDKRRFAPYIFGGFGFTFAPKPAETVFTINFPVGVGVKYKVAHRLNIGCELSLRFSLSDKLDVTNADGLQLNDPYQIKGRGFKNKDSYGFALFFITYDLFAKCRECNN